jgi:hypothetical protein
LAILNGYRQGIDDRRKSKAIKRALFVTKRSSNPYEQTPSTGCKTARNTTQVPSIPNSTPYEGISSLDDNRAAKNPTTITAISVADCHVSRRWTMHPRAHIWPDNFMRSTRKVIFPKQDAVAKVRQQKNSRSAYHPQPAKSSTMAGAGAARHTIPSAFSTPPPIRDSLVTATSAAQDKNIEETLPLIKAAAEGNRDPLEYNKYSVPRLDRLQHIDFLTDALAEYPARFVGIDASRPWMVYWGLMGLHLLGEDVTDYRTRLVPPQLLQFGSCASLSRRLTRA